MTDFFHVSGTSYRGLIFSLCIDVDDELFEGGMGNADVGSCFFAEKYEGKSLRCWEMENVYPNFTTKRELKRYN